MAEMQWKKAPEALVRRFDEVVPKDSGVERRPMFGYPAAFLHGNMLCGLFQDQLLIRLGEADRSTFLKLRGARTFEPMKGRQMKEYVTVPENVLGDDAALGSWLAKSVEYVGSLPRKVGKKKAPAKVAKAAKKPSPKPRQRGR